MPFDLNRFFLEEGSDLNFFQGIHLLERLFRKHGRLGTGDDLRSEPLRFETLNSLAFPGSEIAEIRPPLSFQRQAEELERDPSRAPSVPVPAAPLPPLPDLPGAGRGPLRVSLTFMGLYGVSSPLPSYFVDPITLRKVEYFQLKKFLDIFSHRLYSMFYRSWKKYRHFAQFQPGPPDDYTLRLLALTGQWPRRTGQVRRPGEPAENPPGPLHGGNPPARVGPKSGFDLRRIPYARFLGNRVRSARGLQQLLKGYFGFRRVRVLPFTAAWVEIPVKTRLGDARMGLGVSTRLGDRMEDRLSRFTVEIGPLPRVLFNRFLPPPQGPARAAPGARDAGPRDGEAHSEDGGSSADLLGPVRELIDAYLRDPLEYDVKVILEPDADRIPVLGSEHARMGMGIWLGPRPAGEIACRL